MNEKLEKAKNWAWEHKKGIAIGVGVTAAVIGIAVLLKKCADSDLECEGIQDLVDKEAMEKALSKIEVIEAWKENDGEELRDRVLEKLKDLHEFAKEHDFVLNGMFGFGPDTEFDKEFCDFEIWNDNVMVEYFSNDV